METKVVVSKRFQKRIKSVQVFDQRVFGKTVFNFLDILQQRVELLILHPEIGKLSKKKQNVRSVTLQPRNRIYYRLIQNRIELLCLVDMRKKLCLTYYK